MKKYLQLIRFNHWIKNLIIFIPIFTSKNVNFENLIKISLLCLSFCLVSSFVYIFNDIMDKSMDKLHEQKKYRPIASGAISIKKAILISIFLLIISFAINFAVFNNFFTIFTLLLIMYVIINICYSIWLKNYPITDILLLASGFIIRIYYGASIINVPVSNWLFLTTLSTAIFLGTGKRKKELQKNNDVRKVLKFYTEKYLDNCTNIFLSLTIAFYSLWASEQNNKLILFSVPLLIGLFMYYSLLIEKNDDGDPISVFLKNKLLILYTIIYLIYMLIVFLY